MEHEDEDGPVTPFWLSSSNNAHRKSNRNLLRRSSSLLLNSTVLLIVLLVIAIIFIFVIIPSILNVISQIFKPQLFKKCWESLNLVLVLFAIVCAFLGRNSNHENREASFDDDRSNVASISSRNRNEWYENADRNGNRSFNRLRISNSYPDLRRDPPLMASDDYRFFDDTHLIDHRFSDQDLLQRRPRSSIASPPDLSPPPQQQKQKEKVKRETKRTYRPLADEEKLEKPLKREFELKKSTHLPAPPPPVTLSASPLPSPQSMRVKRKTDRTGPTQVHDERSKRLSETEIDLYKSIAPPSPLPPPPPVKKIGRNDRKRSGSTSTKDLLTLLYQQRRKKKQRQKSVENFDTLLLLPEPPSPPPPQPPQSTVQNMFNSKKHKTKIDPPPPQQSINNKPKTSEHKSSLPTTLTKFDLLDDNTSSGNESSHSSIPPPPPPPPFRMKSWKFAVKGDYVRINSTGSSSSDSPDLDYDGPSSNPEPNLSTSVIDGEDSPPSQTVLFCPSPDVNSKADKFIARIRAGLKLEKVKSINDKHGIGLSKLGPEPNPSSYSE